MGPDFVPRQSGNVALIRARTGGMRPELFHFAYGLDQPSFGKCRICASCGPQSRFGFDGAGSGPKHVPEIERRRSISRAAFHEKPISRCLLPRRKNEEC